MKRLLILTLFLGALAFTGLCGTFCSQALADEAKPIGDLYQATEDFAANWIVPDNMPNPMVPNLWMVYRKSFDLESVPEKAICRISADSKYWLYVNNQLVVFEGNLKRGPTATSGYFDVVDLKPYLKAGKNYISALVCFFGKDSSSHVSSGMPGFLFDASTNGPGGLALISDATWKAALYTAVPADENDPNWREKTAGAYERTTADPQPNYRLSESNNRFDARYDFAGDWKVIDFDDSAWKNAVCAGKAGDAPWGKLYQRLIPMFKDFGLTNYENNADIPAVSTGEPIVCKLPYNLQCTPWLSVEAEPGLVIDIRTDNYNGGSEYNVRGEYVTKAGVQEYENLGWMNGHEVIYSIPKGVKILGLKYRQTGYNTEFTGTFKCDDEFLNKYWDKAQRTLYITMRDNYFDCPDRERAQWWGDAVNEMGEAFYAMDRRADLLPKKGLYELFRYQRENGALHSPIPSITWKDELPAQMLATISTFGLGTYGWYSGDFATGQDLYAGLKRYLAMWKLDEKGLVIPRDGDWSWGDWGDNIDLRPLLNCWYFLAVKNAAQIADSLGLADEAAEYNAIMDGLRKAYNKEFWTGKDYRDPSYKGESDDRVGAMSVVAGFAQPEQFPLLREHFKKELHASPYMEKYVTEALFMMGYPEDALNRLKNRYAKMVNHPVYTTLWEGWGIGAEGFGGGTINHAWSGGGLTALAQYAVGLFPVAPKFEEFAIMPQPAFLKDLELTTDTHFGKIQIEIENEADAMEIEVTVPEGTTGYVGVPKKFQNRVFEKDGAELKYYELIPMADNGNVRVQNFKFPAHGACAACQALAQNYDFYKLTPGKWEVKAK